MALVGLPATATLADDVVVWLKFFQVNGDGAHRPRSIAANATGVYVSGEIADQNGATLQRMVQRYDPAGTMLWERDLSDYPTSGSTDIAVTDDDVYVALNNLVPSAGGGQHEELYLRKYDPSGNIIWTRDVGPEGNGAGPVAADAGGAFIVSTTRNDAGFETGNLISHYDPAGNLLWTHPISFPFGTSLAVGGGALYYGAYDENSSYALHHLDASGNETWHGGSVTWGPVYGAGGAIIQQLGNAPDNATLVKYAADGSIVWSQIVASTGISGLALMAADDSHIYLTGSRSGDFAQMLLTLDANGAIVGVEDDGAWPQNPFQQFVAVDGSMYACCASWPGRLDEGLALAKLRTSQGLSGQVTWSDAYPDRVGQGVANATVTVGSTSVTTDAQGNYTLPAELAGQQATIELPLFDLGGSPGGAAARTTAEAMPRGAGLTSQALKPVTAKVSESLTLTLDPSTGKVKADGTFGKNVSLSAFGQTVNVTTLRITDQGVQSVGGTTRLSFAYDPASPPLTIDATITYVKASNQLTIIGTSGTTFQWGGQTATLDSFEFKAPQNILTMAASTTLNLSQVAISAQLTGTGTADGVTLQAKGQATVAGITVFFDPITVENGQFHVKGHVKLPNQPIDLEFDTTTSFGAPRLILPLPQFQWAGQTLPLHLELLGNAMILAGAGNVQLGGQAIRVDVDTAFQALTPSVSTVHVTATIPVPDGEATARLEYDPAKPQDSSVTGTLKIFLALCPNQKTDFNVDVRATSSTIHLGFHTSLPVDCDGNGTSTLVDIGGDFDGQLATLSAAWPVTVGNVNGRVSATVKGDGTYVQIMFNAELKFGPGGSRSQATGAVAASVHPADAAVHLLLVDGAGQRTGYDPATGQMLNEIPGGQYTGQVNGVDTFTMPGRVGGYGVVVSSQTPQTVQLQVTLNGQPTTYTAHATPGQGTAIAAETIPQNGTVGVQVNPVQVGCAPRPAVHIVPGPSGGTLVATFAPDAGTTIATNAIREIRIGQVQNGTVDGGGRTGLGSGGVINFPSPVRSVTLTVHRVTPEQATTVPLTIVDDCGEWRTFVGGGPTAF